MTPIVGRTDELRELDDAILGAVSTGSRSRGGSLFVISGEPGIGKTRLADEAAARAKQHGFVVHWGRCWEVGGAPAFWPWIQILRSLGRDRATESIVMAYRDVLARLLPELRTTAGASATGDALAVAAMVAEDAHARFQLFDELWALLRAVSEHVPLMLVLDDLHAADPSSMALLRLVSRDLRQTGGLVVIATCRDREAKPEPSVMDAIRAVSREGTSVVLRRLDVDEVGAVLSSRAERDVPRSFAARVWASTDGNPLFLDQVCRLILTHRRSVDRRDLDFDFDFEKADSELLIPAGLRDAIRSRLSTLDAQGRRVLEAAAVLGRDFTIPLVASVLGGATDSDVLPCVVQGVEAGLLQECGLGRFEICHALFRETLYRDLSSQGRAELHARAAEALETATIAERGLGEVARHLLEALPVVGVTRALDGATRAAKRALDALAFEDAASILSMAIEQLGSSLDETQRAETLILLGVSHARSGDPDLAHKACAEAAAVARKRADSELLARAALALGAELMPGQVSAPLITLLTEARDALPATSSRLRARILARLGAALQPAIDPEVPIAIAREAVAMARALGDDATLRTVLLQAGSALVDFGDPSERVGWDSELLDLSERLHDEVGVLRAHVRLFFDHLELGETKSADHQLNSHAEVADRLGVSDHQWRTLVMRRLRALWEGRFDDAETYKAQARRIASRARVPEAPITQLMQDVGVALARSEDLPDVEQLIALTRGFPASREVGLAIRAFSLVQNGEVDAARALVASIPSDSIFFTKLYPGSRFAVDVAAATNDVGLAERLYRMVGTLERRVFSWGRIGMFVEGPVTWLLASLATTMGKLDEGERLFEDALARATAAGMKPYEAIICLEYTRLLRARGPAGSAKLEAITKRGVTLAESLGMPRVVARFHPASTTKAPVKAVRVPMIEQKIAIDMVKDGELWSLQSRDGRGRCLRLKDSRGMQILAQLIASPGREFHVLTLVGADAMTDGGDAGEVLDKKAQTAYRNRAEDLRDQIREAESFGDTGRLPVLREELDRLGEELAAAVGLGGRSRRVGAAAEKARVNVQKRLREAIRRVVDQDPTFGREIERSVRTGTFCAYEP